MSGGFKTGPTKGIAGTRSTSNKGRFCRNYL
jgi:hypothetical protein